jgi:hypothetical protein
MRRNYYNLYQHGKLIKKDILSRELEKIVGIEGLNLVNLAKRNSTFGDDYTVEINRKVVTEPKKKPKPKTGEVQKKWEQKYIDAWNDIYDAAELIRTGKGKIVKEKVNGKWKRYTEVTG